MLLYALSVGTPMPAQPPRASEAVLRVTIGAENVSGVVVSKDGYVITTATFIAKRCGECAIVIHDDGQKGVSRTAVVAAIDRDNDLALLKADGPFPIEAVFAGEARIGQEISTFAYTSGFGRTRWAGNIERCLRARFPREDGRVVFWEKTCLIERVPEPGATGAGAFSADGTFVGMIAGNTAATLDDSTTQKGVIRPATAIKAFLEANGVATAQRTAERKKK
jgi:hypothetical protein